MRKMGSRSDYKKLDEFSSWDMDKGCREIVNQKSPGRRRLRKKLKRQQRARLRAASKIEADNFIFELVKHIAENEFGMTVTISDGPDHDTFESLFGISPEEAINAARAWDGEDTE